MHGGKILRQGPGRAAKADAPGLGRRDALRLALVDGGPLVLRHEGEDLEDNVAEKGPHQVLAPSRVQQGHVQHHDIHPLFLGQHPPLLQDLPIVPAQPVNALDVQHVVPLQPPHQFPVLGPVKVLAGLVVPVQILLRDLQLPHGQPLPLLVLVPGADPDVPIVHP